MRRHLFQRGVSTPIAQLYLRDIETSRNSIEANSLVSFVPLHAGMLTIAPGEIMSLVTKFSLDDRLVARVTRGRVVGEHPG